MGVEIEKTSSNYIIRFEYRPYHLVKLKNSFPPKVPRWDHREKHWLVPLSMSAMVANYASATKAIWKHDKVTEPLYAGAYDKVDLPDLEIELPNYIFNREKKAKGEPYEVMQYQLKGIARGMQLGRFINGDQPGLGKTIQAIATAECQELLQKNTVFPCLIICPSSLKENWKREIKTWTGKDAMILDTNVKHNYRFYSEAGLHEYFIVNYESLKKYFVEKFTNAKGQRVMVKHVVFRSEVNMFKSVIIDEFHRVKLASTLQAVLTKGVCIGKKLVQGLTGTPVVNRPIDLCSQLSIIGRMGEIVGYKEFLNRYCAGPKQASNLKELNALLTNTCFFRREKTEVLKDLPAKTRQVIVCDIDNRDEYNVAHRDVARYMKEFMNATDKQIKKSLKGEVMVRIGILKRISAKGKLAAAIEHIKDMNYSGQKMVIFALEHVIVDALTAALPGLLKITGRETSAEIEENKSKFQSDPQAMNILVSLKCSEGHTLTASSYPFFIEIPWTFAACEQCEDRTHRVGQHDNVTAQYLLGHNTIDQRLYQIVLEKKSIAMDITGASDDVPESTMSLLIDLFNQKEIEA